MRKYAFVVHHDDYRDFLKDLQEAGVAHLVQSRQGWSPAAEPLIAKYQRYRGYLQLLNQRNQTALPAEQCRLATELVRDLESRLELRYALEQGLQTVRAQLLSHQEWANVPLEAFRQLEARGLHAHFYRCPRKAFQSAWAKKGHLETYGEEGEVVHFVLLTSSPQPPALEAESLLPPETATATLEEKRRQLEQQVADNECGLDILAAERHGLMAAMEALAESVQWHQALHQTDSDVSGRLRHIQAWVPQHESAALEGFLDQRDIAWLRLDVRPDDDIPVLLKNNRFARLFQPIGALFALPNAAEMDLTAFFAPFFALFFGLCLGDLGYGAILFTAGTVFKFLPAGKPHRDALTLLQWLSFATMVAGVITGTIFGAPLGKLALFAPYTDLFLGPDQLFRVALWIGLFQIATGMALRIVNRTRQFGFLYGLSSLGWLLGLTGSVLLWNEWAAPYNLWLTLSGVGLILLFSEPKGNIFKRVGLGLWELYGASGLVGDMLSYIRLFALGLSSSILGLVVNDIAMDVRGDGSLFGWLFFLIILAIGHGMNFFLATLSAFVHPMRLTFVEFYKNAGFAGGGKSYQPFSKKLKPEL